MPVQNPISLLLLVALILLGGCTANQPVKPDIDSADNAAGASGHLVELADGVASRGQPETALAIYQRVLVNDAQNRGALLGKGRVLTTLGRYAEAERTLRQARDLYPQNVAVLSAYGRLLITSGRAEIAVGELGTYLEAHPLADAGLWNLQGLAFDALHRHGDAERAYREGLARAPQSISIRNNLAYSLILQGEYARAADMLKQLVDTEGGQPRHRQNLALAYALEGDEQRAREVARLDLQGEAVERNLAYYQWLRELPAPTRYQALLRKP